MVRGFLVVEHEAHQRDPVIVLCPLVGTWRPGLVGPDETGRSVITIPWPRYPTTTPGGKPSKSKMAGRLIPWLSANVVNNLPAPVYRSHKIAWREAARVACHGEPHDGPVEVDVWLMKATSHEMDPLAVLEGLKPIVDGLEAAGLLVNDRLVVGGHARAVKAASRAQCRVELTLFPVLL